MEILGIVRMVSLIEAWEKGSGHMAKGLRLR